MPPSLRDTLSLEKAYIFRITHRANLKVILRDGAYCRSAENLDPGFTEIGNPEIIGRRALRPVPCPPGGTLADYVPFYFSPCTPMLYNIVSGYKGMRQRSRSEIAVMVSSLDRLDELELDFVLADRNATLRHATIAQGRGLLASMPWDRWRDRDFRGDPSEPSRMETYQAEALVHHHLPVDAILGIITYDESTQDIVKKEVSTSGRELRVSRRPDWYP